MAYAIQWKHLQIANALCWTFGNTPFILQVGRGWGGEWRHWCQYRCRSLLTATEGKIKKWTFCHWRIHLNKGQLCLTLALRLLASQQATHTRRLEGRSLTAAASACRDLSHLGSAQFGNCHFNYMDASTSGRSSIFLIYLFIFPNIFKFLNVSFLFYSLL